MFYQKLFKSMIKGLGVILFFVLSTSTLAVEIDWNDDNLLWHDYSEGIELIKKEKKVGLLIFYADWCSVCKEYSQLFANSYVANELKDVILIRVNRDENLELSEKYNFDGVYIPRTFALNSEGNIVKSLYDEEDRFAYFLPPDIPAYLFGFIKQLKKKNEKAKSH